MRRQRFPFLILPPAPQGDPTRRIIRSLALMESSLEELREGHTKDSEWRGFFLALLPVLDGIGGLREAVEKSGEPAWRRGMEIVTEKLDTLLASRGLERIGRVGEPFDAALHRTAGARRAPEIPEGGIAEVLQDGWTLEGAVLRPATVIVCREDE